jgi:3-hydroxyisobutyrate dehydrogenase
MQIAFVGLGNMGAPMSRNLIKHGHDVVGHDVATIQRERFAAAGGRLAPDLAASVRTAEVVVTMLPASEHVRDVYLSPDGVMAHCRRDAILVDCSTIAAATAREVAARAAAAGLAMLDAPVSGGTTGAEAGTLTFMVGGDPGVLARVRPLLDAMGKAVYHAGPAGAGQVAKMCNNLMLGIQMVGACEALKLGIAHGLDPARISEIMLKSSGRNWVLEVYNPCPQVLPAAPASRGYSGGFSSDLMLKDLGLANDAAAATGAPAPLGMLAREIYRLHHEQGRGGLDFSSVFEDSIDAVELFRRLAGAKGG